MELDEPVFRDVFIPWYDSEIVCRSMIAFMIIVFVFGLFGISAAVENVEYQQHLWVPVALMVMSFHICVSVAIRLLRRNMRRRRRQH